MSLRLEKVRSFRALHRPGDPLLLPNPWDAGVAKLLASLGYRALATTSAGFAGTLGRADGGVSRDEVLGHCETIVAASELPVSADLEQGFADDPEGVAECVRRAAASGLAGCSIEDFSGDPANPIYDANLAAERVGAAVEVARQDASELVLTARAENYLHGRNDLDDTIRRLQRFAELGADVVYAPGLREPDEIRSVVESVSVPVNVLLLPGGPEVSQLRELGVARISVGSAFYLASVAAIEEAGRELLEKGTLGFWQRAVVGMQALKRSL